MTDEIVELLYRHGTLNPLDRVFAYFIGKLARSDNRELLLGAALVSHATENGDVCLDLVQHADKPLLNPDQQPDPPRTPALERWLQTLRNCALVGRPGEFKPLVLDEGNRLYLYRYWDYEQQLAEDLRRRAARSQPVPDEQQLQADLTRLFPKQSGTGPDWQKIAATVAVLRGFSVISGAPGTGKTTTLAKILALLLAQTPSLTIRLAAPTGKAAARMQEAIRITKQTLTSLVDPAVLEAIPEQASTLHRLLGPRMDSVYFRHHKDNPLPLDVLVIDEASMVDLPLMTKTVWALPPRARLILLGDKDQLSSVEAGFVLGDICAGSGGYSAPFARELARLTQEAIPATHGTVSPLPDTITELQHSYRFGGDSGIGKLARAVNRGQTSIVQALLRAGELADIQWSFTPRQPEEYLIARMRTGYHDYLQAVKSRQPILDIFAAFDRYQVLCAQRSGRTGVETLNMLFETLLKSKDRRSDQAWYPGRPIMVTCNDYLLRLFNGDIGIALPDPADEGKLRIFFRATDGSLRSLSPTRLPAFETAFALTVHKSQGSEFDEVLLVLPEEKSRVLTRELIYTGITRAKRRVDIWGDPELFAGAAKKTIARSSGLRAKLHPLLAGNLALPDL